MSKENDRVASQVSRNEHVSLISYHGFMCTLFLGIFFVIKWKPFDEFVLCSIRLSLPLWWFDLNKERELWALFSWLFCLFLKKRICQFVRLSLCLDRAHTSHIGYHTFHNMPRKRGTFVELSIAPRHWNEHEFLSWAVFISLLWNVICECILSKYCAFCFTFSFHLLCANHLSFGLILDGKKNLFMVKLIIFYRLYVL